MNNRSIVLLVPTLLLFALGLGCIRVPAGVSASTTPLGNRSYTVIGDTFGEDHHYDLLGIVPLSQANHLQNAIDNAKKKAGADALIDVTVESVRKTYILFTSYTVEVHGKGIKFN